MHEDLVGQPVEVGDAHRHGAVRILGEDGERGPGHDDGHRFPVRADRATLRLRPPWQRRVVGQSVEGPHGVGEDPASIVLHSDQGQRGALPCRNGQVLVERGAERVRVPHDQQHPHLNPLFAAGLSVQSGDLGGRFGVGVVDDDQHGSLRTDGGGQDLRRPSRPRDPGRPALWQRTGHLDSEAGLARTGGARQHPHGQGGWVGAPRQQLVPLVPPAETGFRAQQGAQHPRRRQHTGRRCGYESPEPGQFVAGEVRPLAVGEVQPLALLRTLPSPAADTDADGHDGDSHPGRRPQRECDEQRGAADSDKRPAPPGWRHGNRHGPTERNRAYRAIETLATEPLLHRHPFAPAAAPAPLGFPP